MYFQVCCVYDSKARAFISPFFVPTIQVAVRAVSEAGQDPSHMFAKFPEDYVLWHLGGFDDSTGLLEPLVPPVNLGFVNSVVNQVKGNGHGVSAA